MSLNDNLSAKGISNFASPADQLITLTIGQLRDLITQAVREAIQPLHEELSELRDTVASQREELDAMRAKLADLESREEQDVDRICLDIAQDRQRIARLEQRQPTPTSPPKGEKTLARIAKIEEVLKSRGPTTLKQLEQIMKITPKEMNRLLAKLDMRRYELHARPGNAREKVLSLKVRIV